MFFRVTLPLAARGIVAGVLLAFARALGEFGATLMIAGNLPGRTQTLSVAIYEAVQAGDDATANLLVLVTSVTCVVVLLLADGWCRCPAGVIRGTMSVAIQIRKRMVSGDRHFALDVDVTSRSKRIALFGPSGAGKSLTLRAVAGLLRPDAGRIDINGRALFDSAQGICLPPQSRRVAYLFQDYALFPHLTVAQNIAFGMRRGWRNPPRKQVSEQARRWVDAFELGAIVGSYPSEISGGQKQRVSWRGR